MAKELRFAEDARSLLLAGVDQPGRGREVDAGSQRAQRNHGEDHRFPGRDDGLTIARETAMHPGRLLGAVVALRAAASPHHQTSSRWQIGFQEPLMLAAYHRPPTAPLTSGTRVQRRTGQRVPLQTASSGRVRAATSGRATPSSWPRTPRARGCQHRAGRRFSASLRKGRGPERPMLLGAGWSPLERAARPFPDAQRWPMVRGRSSGCRR